MEIDSFKCNKSRIEDLLSKFNIKPKISGSYKKNFAGKMINLKTGKETPDPPKIRKVDWTFYSDNPNRLILLGYYAKGYEKIESFLIYKHNKLPAHLTDCGGSWLYRDELRKNLEHVQAQEKKYGFEAAWSENKIKWLYQEPAFYSKKTIEFDWETNLASLMLQMKECKDECFVDSVDLNRSSHLKQFLFYPLMNKVGFKDNNNQMKQLNKFSEKVWKSLF